jgi:hypothetical protein
VARIVVTGTSLRAFNNWEPAFRCLTHRGHRIETLFFPNLTDPDHAGLKNVSFPQLSEIPIPHSLRGIEASLVAHQARTAAGVLARDLPDGLVLTTCHAGPEPALARLLQHAQPRPVVIGCQHGVVQNWHSYWNDFQMDHLLVFGDQFARRAPESLRSRIHSVGLPKLDAITGSSRLPFSYDHRPILFAAQTSQPDRMLGILHDLQQISGRDLHVRPHPEFPTLFTDSGFTVVDNQELLLRQLENCSLVVTSGSTTVLEALVARCPCVVLPLERGDEYTAAGIVATTGEAEEILAIASRQQTPPGRALLSEFLEDTVGVSQGWAAARTAKRIATLIGVEPG